jgi:hypothetical protein
MWYFPLNYTRYRRGERSDYSSFAAAPQRFDPNRREICGNRVSKGGVTGEKNEQNDRQNGSPPSVV